MKKKIIRLNEQDVENLVRKIIKEEGTTSFDWAIDEYEPLKNIDDTKISQFKEGDKTTYDGHPVTIIRVDGNFLQAQYDDTGGIFEVPTNPALMRSQDPNYDHYKYQHGKKKLTSESSFNWDAVLGHQDDKWNDLEEDIMSLVEKYKNNFGKDSYAVIDVIYQILDGMFQKR